MAKKTKKPLKTCADCIHEFACGMWNIGYIHNMDATNCTNYETIDDIPLQVATALDMAISALRAQQEQERNEPLTLDELRRMDGKTWLAYRHQLKNTTEG